MNSNTKQRLIELTRQVQQLASAVVLHVGAQTVSEVSQACIDLEEALVKDETILGFTTTNTDQLKPAVYTEKVSYDLLLILLSRHLSNRYGKCVKVTQLIKNEDVVTLSLIEVK